MRDDMRMAASLAAIAMCVATAAHEAAGHGSACLLAGGRITELTSVYFRCTAGSASVSLAGPLGNLTAGILALIALKAVPPRAVRARLLAVGVMALSLFWAAGYLVDSMIENRGDYAIAGQVFLGEPSGLWRAPGILLGIGLYLTAARLVAGAMRGFSPARTRNLLRATWLAATAFAMLAAVFYTPDRSGAIGQGFLEIGANSFPLLIIGWRKKEPENDAPAITFDTGWFAAAVAIFAVFAATLGRGIF